MPRIKPGLRIIFMKYLITALFIFSLNYASFAIFLTKNYTRVNNSILSLKQEELDRLVDVAVLDNFKISNRFMKQLAKAKNIVDLNFDFVDLQDSHVAYLKTLPKLEKVMFYRNLQLTGKTLWHLSHIKSLKDIVFFCNRFTDRDVAQLAKLDKLEYLFLVNSKLSGEFLKYFNKDSRINELAFKLQPGISPYIEELLKFKQLKALDLDYGHLYDSELKVICKIINLEELAISETEVTDNGMQFISNLKKLKKLVINNIEISDASVEPLSKLKNLKWMFVNATNITKEGYLKLKKALPQCDVAWSPKRR